MKEPVLHAAHLEPEGQARRVGLLRDGVPHDLVRLGRERDDGGGRLEIFGGRCHGSSLRRGGRADSRRMARQSGRPGCWRHEVGRRGVASGARELRGSRGVRSGDDRARSGLERSRRGSCRGRSAECGDGRRVGRSRAPHACGTCAREVASRSRGARCNVLAVAHDTDRHARVDQLRGRRGGADVGLRRHVPDEQLDLHLRQRVPGGAHRPRTRARPGLLQLRRPPRRQEGRPPGREGGRHPHPRGVAEPRHQEERDPREQERRDRDAARRRRLHLPQQARVSPAASAAPSTSRP